MRTVTLSEAGGAACRPKAERSIPHERARFFWRNEFYAIYDLINSYSSSTPLFTDVIAEHLKTAAPKHRRLTSTRVVDKAGPRT